MPKSEMLPRRRTIILAVVLALVAIVLGVTSLLYRTSVETGSGVALIGGPFTLVNQKGETVTEKSFAGKYMLLFFGYTYCPDICPTELQVMSKAIDDLGKNADQITPIFVTIDPERDTREVVANYVSSFHERLIGLTGTPDQIAAMAKAYRVFYAKVANQTSPKDYLMDHSSIVYLMGKDGKFLKHFAYSTDPAVLVEGLRQALAN
jgi:cytochrome oxidase Cu insertion factor (SCO1/SenC/PrrC family)